MPYETWMKKVDRLVEAMIGVSVHDLSDFCSRDMYDAGDTPIETAREAIRDDDLAGTYFSEI